MSSAVTRGVQVDVRVRFVPQRSAPPHAWFFAYEVTICNLGATPVRLLARHWIITNGHSRVEEVRGPGVVGEQPLLAPGEVFRYASACPLDTPTGTMRGSYTMVPEGGSTFEAEIAEFPLFDPEMVN